MGREERGMAGGEGEGEDSSSLRSGLSRTQTHTFTYRYSRARRTECGTLAHRGSTAYLVLYIA